MLPTDFDLVLNEIEAQERFLSEINLGAIERGRDLLARHRHQPQTLMLEWAKAQDQLLAMSEVWAVARVWQVCKLVRGVLQLAIRQEQIRR